MQKYLLPADVHVCKVDDAVVFLDLRSNKYLTIPPHYMSELDSMVEGFTDLGPTTSGHSPVGDGRTASGIGPLLANGLLLAPCSGGKAAGRTVIQATKSIPPGQRRSLSRVVRTSHLRTFSVSFSYVYMNLRLNRLKALVDQIRKLRGLNAHTNLLSEADFELLDSFRRIRTFVYTAKNHCLLNSLVLAHFLHSYQRTPTFIIGVRTKPFVAHAWVQIGACVLDDKLEELQNFTPILAI